MRPLEPGPREPRPRHCAGALALDAFLWTTPSRDLLDAAAGLRIIATGGTLNDLDEAGRAPSSAIGRRRPAGERTMTKRERERTKRAAAVVAVWQIEREPPPPVVDVWMRDDRCRGLGRWRGDDAEASVGVDSEPASGISFG